MAVFLRFLGAGILVYNLLEYKQMAGGEINE